MRNKIVLLGGTGQIGYAIATFFVQRHWEVYLVCRSQHSFDSFISLLEKESLVFVSNIKPIYGTKEDDSTLVQISLIQPIILVDLLAFIGIILSL